MSCKFKNGQRIIVRSSGHVGKFCAACGDNLKTATIRINDELYETPIVNLQRYRWWLPLRLRKLFSLPSWLATKWFRKHLDESHPLKKPMPLWKWHLLSEWSLIQWDLAMWISISAEIACLSWLAHRTWEALH